MMHQTAQDGTDVFDLGLDPTVFALPAEDVHFVGICARASHNSGSLTALSRVQRQRYNGKSQDSKCRGSLSGGDETEARPEG